MSKFESLDKVEGIRYDPKTKTLSNWVIFKGNKPKVINIHKGEEGMALVKTIDSTKPMLVATQLIHKSMFIRAQIKHTKEMNIELQRREMEMNLIKNIIHVKSQRLENELYDLKSIENTQAIVVYEREIVDIN